MTQQRLSRDDRADKIIATAKRIGHPCKPAELAKACGRIYGDRFSRDLSYARHRALDEDHKLSHCASLDGVQVLTYREQTGDCVTIKALHKVVRTAGTYTRNAGRAAEWESRHGETDFDRAYGSLVGTWATASGTMLDALYDFYAKGPRT